MIAHGEFRFGVLFGESGSGKTSLLKASVLPRLRDAGFVPLYCRSYKDPVASLLDECRRQSGLAIGDAEEITDYLKRVCHELCAPVVIVCDQFEEFFVNHKTRRERQPLIALVGQCYNDEKLAVKFLFSLRSDFLYTISSEFAGRVPEPLTAAISLADSWIAPTQPLLGSLKMSAVIRPASPSPPTPAATIPPATVEGPSKAPA